MSQVLRKARDKARDRALRAFTGSSRGTHKPSVGPTSYKQMKQTNDAFNAILDDDSELFGMESDVKVAPTSETLDHREIQHDLFDDDTNKEPKIDRNNLFDDNFDQFEPVTTQHDADDLFSDDFLHVQRESGHHSKPTEDKVNSIPSENTLPTNEVTLDSPDGAPPVTSSPQSPTEPSQFPNEDRQPVDGGSDKLESESDMAVNIRECVTTRSTELSESEPRDHTGAISSEETTMSTHSPLVGVPSDDVIDPSSSNPPSRNSREPSVLSTDQEAEDSFSESKPSKQHLSPPINTRPGSSASQSVSSSYEEDHFLSDVRSKRAGSSGRSDDEVASLTGVLDELLTEKPREDHPLVVSNTASSSRHLDSGVFDSDSLSKDRIDIQEDHFSNKSVPPALHKTPPKRNSAGKLPPIRPALSPSLRRRLNQRLSQSDKKARKPADDLFEDDFIKVPSTGDLTPSSKLLRKQSDRIELATTQEFPSKEVPPLHSLEQPQPKRKVHHVIGDPYLTLPYHLGLCTLLYFYYSFNPWSYLAGVLAGVLMTFLAVGTGFVYYVVTQEQKEERTRDRRKLRPSNKFLQQAKTDFNKVREYKSTKFMAVLKYDQSTHHPSQRMKATVELANDFFIKVKIYHDPGHASPFPFGADLRICTVENAPEEIVKNRKRRWNKKFPIYIQNTHNNFRVYLFAPTSRDKEDWFRRLRQASDGMTSDDIIKNLSRFFGYMEQYFPSSLTQSNARPRLRKPPPSSTTRKQLANKGNRIAFSKDLEHSLLEDDSKINITRETGPRVSRHSRRHTSTQSTASQGRSMDRKSSTASLDDETVFVPHPTDTLWLNTVAARLCWDVWHDQRWKDWTHSRIQKILSRVKTPAFMEQLTLTDIELGHDMPVVKGLSGGPNLDLRGVWVYLDVTYEGCFVMTIKTRLKLGEKDKEEQQGQQMSVVKSKGSLPVTSPHSKHSSTRSGLSHSSAARALGSSVDPYDEPEIDSGSSDEETSSVMGQSIVDELRRVDDVPEDQPRDGMLKSAVKKLGKRVANSSLVRRAFEKFSSYPLVLTVVVNRLDGELAINIPPPNTDTIWFGFRESPRLELSAKPKLGNREVKLSAVTQWIEKRLREVVSKKLVLPEMENVGVKILNSGLPEDTQKVLVTDDDKK